METSTAHPRTLSSAWYICSYERLAAIVLTALAVASPLFIDRKHRHTYYVLDSEEEIELVNFSFWLPLLLLVLMFAIILTLYCDRTFARFDVYWIHRVGGSSGGIVLVLVMLALILKLKA
ncbi:hypothetical protein MLD38_015123 [Melastoma candidum]|uniref:Uncharacterized protein n=1 Tax=Melastoma candidum TaxID=119954 RepID=A0ACB9RG92_9MYRT|nr:hypothetical protein MLD38_015123 [Melastoma candidum]